MKRLLYSVILTLHLIGVQADQPWSGTLPVLFIVTEDSADVVSKDEYLNAHYWLDPMGCDTIAAIGTEQHPYSTLIKGRGNYTWVFFDKKPYRLKLSEKQPLMGMKANRHFTLLPHADDRVGFLRNTVAFELSRRIGMPFTPAQQPIELVLNGDYKGLYFLTEAIRVGKNRVDITEQPDVSERPDSITGGWLVEIDNNRDAQQLEFDVSQTPLAWFWITHHSPDSLSQAQHDYLYSQFTAIIDAIYSKDYEQEPWTELIDVESLARFYIVNEMVDHIEAFLGSCYLYKDYMDTKWKFGPVWDFGHAFNSYHNKQLFIYQDAPPPEAIIKQIAEYPAFQAAVRRVWRDFYPTGLEGIDAFISSFLNQIAEAAKANYKRWPSYGNRDVKVSGSKVLPRLNTKVALLEREWHTDTGVDQPEVVATPPRYYDLSGRPVPVPHRRGLYIVVTSGGKREVRSAFK